VFYPFSREPQKRKGKVSGPQWALPSEGGSSSKHSGQGTLKKRGGRGSCRGVSHPKRKRTNSGFLPSIALEKKGQYAKGGRDPSFISILRTKEEKIPVMLIEHAPSAV